MSVAAAGRAVSTQQHQPTAEQIRLARLIEDKKHDHPEVQEIVRKVLDIVTDSNQDDALLALFDCDYDYEKAVALLIEKGHEVASEWRTATNHKVTKKQQQQKNASTKNGHGDTDENGYQRGNGHTSRGNSRRYQQNGGDSQNLNNPPSNENSRQRGGSGYRGRGNNRGNNRGGFRGTDRHYQQQQQQQTQDSNVDNLSPSDTNRRNRNPAVPSGQQQPPDQWDVGNWNGETLIYSRTTKEDEPTVPTNDSSEVLNGQSDANNQQTSKPDFDPIEAARQIKSVIGIGQTSKSSTSEQQQPPPPSQQKSKSTGPPLVNKGTPPPQPRIPQQPVIFSDHFDGGMHKIDVQFGNLDEPSSAFYQSTDTIPSNKVPQRTTEQSARISSSIRPTDQPVMNPQQQRILSTQIPQQPPQSIPIKSVVPPQYTVHQQQHQINPQNMLLQSLLYHPQAQPEITLDTSYDPTTFSLPSMDFNSPYFMAAPPQQQTQPRYLVSQPPPHPQPAASKTAPPPSGSASTTSTGAKKAPAVPPGIFPPTGVPPLPQQPAYSAAYGVQQPAGGATYSTPYDLEHSFANSFISLSNPQQAQSPTGTYGSVTPPNQQQGNNTNDAKTLNYRPQLAENLMLLQQYQQYALQQSNSQQQGQQPSAHSQATLSYFLSHPPAGAGYSPGHQIMYAPAATPMAQQQQIPKQQGQQYNQTNPSAGIGGTDDYYVRNSSSSTKEGQYLYQPAPPPQSTGQQQGVNKGQQRSSGNVYNNHQGQSRPFQ